MSIDMITENVSSLTTSPRISFSNNNDNNNNFHEINASSPVSSSSSDCDFDFCISKTEAEISPADELFSDGLIRPVQLREKFVNPRSFSLSRPHCLSQLEGVSLPRPPPLPPLAEANYEPPKQAVSEVLKIIEKTPQNHQTNKSFWRIKRSSSLHSESGLRKGSIWSLPLLSRSNSTGSITKKQSTNTKKSMVSSSSSSSNGGFYTYPFSQKPPLRKSYGGSQYSGNGVRISPVLNVPPPCNIKGSGNLFGFGSFFLNGKDQKNKK